MTYHIPYDLCLDLDLFIKVKKKHRGIIEDEGILEDVKINETSDNGYINDVVFSFKILDTIYTIRNSYNTSSPYALYMCELYDYNRDYNINDDDD